MQTQIVHKQYISTQVSTADRLQLVVMLPPPAAGRRRPTFPSRCWPG